MEIKLGVVLTSYVYNLYRSKLAEPCFSSLLKTENPNKHKLLLLYKPSGFEYPVSKLGEVFETIAMPDPQDVKGTEQSLAYGTQYLFDTTNVTHAVWMGDDALFNPRWLVELEYLIRRHPQAKSWSVYRSAHEAYHKTLREEGADALVTSICGHGLTFERGEWSEFGIDWRQGTWRCAAGGTIDLVHPYYRPGERWVTQKSYVDHVGKYGVHCRPHIPEYGLNFVGVN
jgi:hypothetical protein